MTSPLEHDLRRLLKGEVRFDAFSRQRASRSRASSSAARFVDLPLAIRLDLLAATILQWASIASA